MNIKNVKPTNKSRYKQGYYRLLNESKYTGPKPIIYRSSWERKFSEYCDTTPNILKWSSEPFAIKYWNLLDNKFHTYYPDFYIKIKRGDHIEECIVEVKPKAQLRKPKPPKRRTIKAMKAYNYAVRSYVTNLCKISALKKFAKFRNYKIILLTEDSCII